MMMLQMNKEKVIYSFRNDLLKPDYDIDSKLMKIDLNIKIYYQMQI